jgi:hypothetical protein
MATAPQFVTTPNKGTPGSLTAANTALDGTGATGRLLLFTAGSSGSILPAVRAMHLGTNVATLIRVFRNNGSDPAVAGNNTLVAEKAIASNTVSHTAESIPYDIPLNMTLAGGANPERIYVTLATAVAAGIQITPINGGDF